MGRGVCMKKTLRAKYNKAEKEGKYTASVF
jgi:hypothetical protein